MDEQETRDSQKPSLEADESEQQRDERRLRNAEKMESLGRLAGRIAHDLNNFLTVLAGYGQMMQDGLNRGAPPEKLQVCLTGLLEAGTRAGGLTEQLQTFSGRKLTRPGILNLVEHIRNQEQAFRELLKPAVELTSVLPSEPCFIRMGPEEMTQLLAHVADHAREAMPAGGRLILRIEPGTQSISGPASIQYVLLEFRDSAPAMDEITESRILEPFFSLNKRGKSPAFGMASVYGLMKQNDGDVLVERLEHEGNSIQLYFPSLSAEGLPLEPEIPSAESATHFSGTETILLAEDDPSVRGLVEAMLRRLGYQLLVARNGQEAIQIFEERSSEIHLLLTDIIMPHKDGRELAEQIWMANPAFPVLFMSGYTPDEFQHDGHRSSVPQLLRKPFNAEVLGKAVRHVLKSAGR